MKKLLLSFMSGGIIVANWAIGLFFLRFWRKSSDRLLLLFALAFWVFAAERALLLFLAAHGELNPAIYLARIFGFGLIVWGILEKNRPRA